MARPHRIGGLILGSFAVALAFAPAAFADTFVPNKLGDHTPNGCTHRDCTLREAVIRSNKHAGRDTILLASKGPYELRIPPSPSDGPLSGDLNVSDPVTIKHPGEGRATIDANGIDRVLQQTTDTSSERYTKLVRIVITGGYVNSFGGGVAVGRGFIGFVDSQIIGNRASLEGGGVYASIGELTITRSTIAGNLADGSGGGIFAFVPATIRSSTISNNLSADPSPGSGIGGGGIDARAELNMQNDTVANNRAYGGGGGLLLGSGPTVLNSVTIVDNLADANNDGYGPAGGVFGPATVGNSIIARNRSLALTAQNCRGTFVSNDHNMIGNPPGTGCETLADDPDNIVTSNPLLGKLKDNGGPTRTVALLAGSPALNAAGPSSPKIDQRGVKRLAHPDIGAFERR